MMEEREDGKSKRHGKVTRSISKIKAPTWKQLFLLKNAKQKTFYQRQVSTYEFSILR